MWFLAPAARFDHVPPRQLVTCPPATVVDREAQSTVSTLVDRVLSLRPRERPANGQDVAAFAGGMASLQSAALLIRYGNLAGERRQTAVNFSPRQRHILLGAPRNSPV